MKASIRKLDGQWRLTRPAYGFSSEPSVTVCESWEDARQRLLGPASASAGPLMERGLYTHGLRAWNGWPRRGTIRMEEQ